MESDKHFEPLCFPYVDAATGEEIPALTQAEQDMLSGEGSAELARATYDFAASLSQLPEEKR